MERNSLIRNQTLRKTVHCGIFIALAVALYSVSPMIPIGGVGGIRIGFSAIIKKIPCLMFGPWYGMAICGLVDVLGYLVAPSGAYIPMLTLVYILQGFMIGGLYRTLNKFFKSNSYGSLIIKIFIVLLISDITMTILSSWVLTIFVPVLAKKGFWLVFLPRFTEEIISIFICTYIDATLIMIYNKAYKG